MFKLAVVLFVVTFTKAETFRSILTNECNNVEGCYCDYFCEKFGDCCSTLKELDFFNKTKTPERDRKNGDCVSIKNIFPEYTAAYQKEYVNVIASCPNSEEVAADLIDGCSLSVEPSAQHFELEIETFAWLKSNIRYIAPVVDVYDRRVYGNIDCAICNGVFGSHQKNVSLQTLKQRLLVYPLSVACGDLSNKTYCQTSWKIPKSLTRYCPLNKKRGRLLPNPLTSLSLDELFIMPDDYFTTKPIRLPFETVQEDNSTETRTEEPSLEVMSHLFFWAQMTLILFSIVALSVMLGVYSRHSKLRSSLAGRLTMGLAVALLSFQVCFLLVTWVVPQINRRGFCVTMATALFYFALCSFVWMTLFAAQLLETFGNCKSCLLSVLTRCHCLCLRPTDGGRGRNLTVLYAGGHQHHSSSAIRFRKHLLVAILIPLTLVAPALLVNEYAYSKLAPYYVNLDANETVKMWNETRFLFNVSQEDILGKTLAQINPGFCLGHVDIKAWFGTRIGLTIWFLTPAASMICFNAIALLIVCVQIVRLKKETRLPTSPQNEQERKRQERSKNLATICVKLVIILGGSWFIQVIASWWLELTILRKLAGLANSAQGGVIAVSVLLSSKVRRVMVKSLPKFCQPFTPVTTTEGEGGEGITSTKSSSRTWTSAILPKAIRPRKKSTSFITHEAI